MNISIRLMVVIITISFAVVQTATNYLHFSLSTEKEILKEQELIFSQYMNIAQGNINFLSSQNDINGITNQLSSLATTHNISDAILLNSSLNVIASANVSHLGKSIFDVLPAIPKDILSSNHATEPFKIYNINQCKCFISDYPIYQEDNNELTLKKSNILIVKYSYEHALQTAFYTVEQIQTRNLLYLILLTVILGISFHLLITDKMSRLVAVTEKITKGNLLARTNITGKNEIGRLGESIDKMACSLSRNSKELHLQQQALDNHSIVAFTDKTGKITFVNDKFCEVSQYSRNEIIGKSHSIVNSGTHPRSFFANLWDTISSGNVWHGEIVNRKKNGDLYYVETTIVPFLDDDGKPSQYIAIRTDVSKQREIQKLLEQSQKMETMGQLTGGIAHDFNNILASIMGYTELSILKIELNDTEKLPNYLAQIQQASERARNLISQMLMFSNTSKNNDTTSDIISVINEAKQLLGSTMPASISIQYHVSEDLPGIGINPTKFHQILMNLCINARDSIDEKGVINIDANKHTLTTSYCSACNHTFSGEYIRVSISDNGKGISNDIIEKIFTPFFTTRKNNKGTGIGLSVVKDIVHEANGHIMVSSTLGNNSGTVFQLYFPVLSDAHEKLNQQIDNIAEDLRGNNERILIVDDEAMIARFEAELLASHGYKTSTNIDSGAALRRFNANPDEFDLFIFDQTMPSLSGLELAKKILSIRPKKPIILCTGFSENVNETIALQEGIQGFLTKPLDSTTLLKLIKKLLEENGNSVAVD